MLTYSLRKEVRQMAPVWAGGLLIALFLALGMSGTEVGTFGIRVPWSTFLVPLLAVICSLLATAAFGREMAMGTLSSMLAAPEPRSRWWREKVAITGAALLTVAVAFTLIVLSSPAVRSDVGLTAALASSWIIPWCALGPGVYLTLLLRHPVGAFWLTMLIPGGIATALISVGPWLGIATTETALWLICSVLFVYGATGLVLSKREIDRWQDTGFGTQELTLALPGLRRRSGDDAVERVHRRTPLRS
jgi:hypothetical protein